MKYLSLLLLLITTMGIGQTQRVTWSNNVITWMPISPIEPLPSSFRTVERITADPYPYPYPDPDCPSCLK